MNSQILKKSTAAILILVLGGFVCQIHAQNINGADIMFLTKEDLIKYKVESIVDSTTFTVNHWNSYACYTFSDGLISTARFYRGISSNDNQLEFTELNYYEYMGKVVSCKGSELGNPVGVELTMQYDDTIGKTIIYVCWHEYSTDNHYCEDTTIINYYNNGKIKSIVKDNESEYCLYDKKWNWLGYFYADTNIDSLLTKNGFQKFRKRYIEKNEAFEIKTVYHFTNIDSEDFKGELYINGIPARDFLAQKNKRKYKYLIIEYNYAEYIFYEMMGIE